MYASARLLTEAKSFIGNELNASCRRLSKTHSLLALRPPPPPLSLLQWTNKRLINSFRRIVNDNDCDGLCVIEQFVTQSNSNGHCVCLCSIKIVKIRNTLLVIWRVTRWRWAAVRSASTVFFLSSFTCSSVYCIMGEPRWLPGEKAIEWAKILLRTLTFSVHKLDMNLYRMENSISFNFSNEINCLTYSHLKNFDVIVSHQNHFDAIVSLMCGYDFPPGTLR